LEIYKDICQWWLIEGEHLLSETADVYCV